MKELKFSICTTNYNCGHALKRHLDSIYEHLDPETFEYIVVDNKSRDNSLEILKEYEKDRDNMKVLVKRCSTGKGRQIAFKHSKGKHIMVIDTDTIYKPEIADFTRDYFKEYSDTSVQAIFCAIFPRELWEAVGGRANLNVCEDVDMWVKLWRLGKIKWYPFEMGENLKDARASSGFDYLSSRYGKSEKLRRLIRREIALWKSREYLRLDSDKVLKENTIDMGLGKLESSWFRSRPRRGIKGWFKSFAKQVYIILKES